MGTQILAPIVIGWMPLTPGSNVSTLALSGSDGNTWVALSFVAVEALTLTEVSAIVSALAGTGVTVTADLYSDGAAGLPNASIDGPRSLSVSATGRNTWTGFTTTLTAGVRYWIVFKNATATPQTNYPTFAWYIGALGLYEGSPIWGWSKCHTTNGSTWATPGTGVGGLGLKFTDAAVDRYAGFPIVDYNLTSGYKVYSAREFGVKFTTPANATLSLRGLSFYCSYSGAAESLGNLRFRLYAGDTWVADAMAIPVGNMSTSARYLAAYFSSSHTLQPNTTYRVTYGAASGGDASNYYRSNYFTILNDANARAMLPFSMAGCYLNTTWTELNTLVLPFGLVLDTEGSFVESPTDAEIAAAVWDYVGRSLTA